MKIPNQKAEKSLTWLLHQDLQDALTDAFKDLIPRAKAIADANKFSAVESARIEDVASDVGIVRVTASYHLQINLHEHYKLFKSRDQETVVSVDPYSKETRAVLELVINVPLFGQMRISSSIRPGQERVVPGELVINLEGSVGTLWHKDAKEIIAKVKALNLLSAPYFEAEFDPW